VGSGHSPSALTCTSGWMLNLDEFSGLVGVDEERKSVTVEAGMRLYDLNRVAGEHGLTIPSLGSIDEQSVAGAICTGTHGSSMRHGILSSYVLGMRVVLGNGSVVRASAAQNPDLFRAALCSLGALGIIVEVEYQMVDDCRIEWTQTSISLDDLLARWEIDLWTSHEFVRVWWMPYTRRAVIWRAEKTTKPLRKANGGSWYGGLVGYHVYKTMLWVAHYVPRILPTIEWFIFGMQYGFRTGLKGVTSSAVEPQKEGLLMDCLYSQFVNEWALPLSSGPYVIRRLDHWLNNIPHPDDLSNSLPVPTSKGIFVHAPIEVRVSNTSDPKICPRPKPLLDMSCKDTPTLYLNATLYRPYGLDPPCRVSYYKVFETVMRRAHGRPHWAKNFSKDVSASDIEAWYGDDLTLWKKQRDMADPEGIFVGSWLRENVLGVDSEKSGLTPEALPCEERTVRITPMPLTTGGGMEWTGAAAYKGKQRGLTLEQVVDGDDKESKWRSTPTGSSSEESFDHFAAAEAEASVWMEDDERAHDGLGEDEEETE
jgi:D-arabinono-1,4-lactone oxidase